MGTKSNKIKKQEIREKKYLKKINSVPPPAPIVYKITKQDKNVPKLIENALDGELNKYSNKYSFVVGCEEPDFCKRIIRLLLKHKVNFLEKKRTSEEDHHRLHIRVIHKIAKYKKYAVRELEDWKPTSYNTTRQIISLAKHLYAKYPMPEFMNNVWYASPASYYGLDCNNHLNWYLHMGQGSNIRTFPGFPVKLTKKEAHYFSQAPANFTPDQAIRYGQILNLGGNLNFVKKILGTNVARYNQNDEFWFSVFRWFLKNPMLDPNQYGPIIDYVNNKKFVGTIYQGAGYAPVPEQPNLTMKDRDANTLLKEVEEWHKRVGKLKDINAVPQWPLCGIKPYKHESNGIVFTIKEINTYKELLNEGRLMSHCVGSYANSCATGSISIWKLEEQSSSVKKRLTIEVKNQNRTINQARGKYNAAATASDMFHLKKWAEESKLNIASWI